MPSPHSASCHAHTLKLSLPEQKTITLSGQEAPVCSTQQGAHGVLVFLFQKKKKQHNNPKTFRPIKRPGKRDKEQRSWLFLFSLFSLQGNCFSSIFFQCNPNSWKPFQQLLPRQPQHLQAPGSPGAPDMLHCRSNLPTREAESPSEGEKEQQQIYSGIMTLSATDHLMLTRPIPSVLQASNHTGQHQQTTDVLWSHEKNEGAFLLYRHITFPADLSNFSVIQPQYFPSRTFISTAVIRMITYHFPVVQF